jgi:hypothetical protein
MIKFIVLVKSIARFFYFFAQFHERRGTKPAWLRWSRFKASKRHATILEKYELSMLFLKYIINNGGALFL